MDPTLKATGKALGSKLHPPWYPNSHLQFTVYSRSYRTSLYDALNFPFAFSVVSGGFFDILPIIFTFRRLFGSNLIIQLQSNYSIAIGLFDCNLIIRLQFDYSIAE